MKLFQRMVGYDVWIDDSVMPMMRGADWNRGKDNSIVWTVSLDHRVVRAVREAHEKGRVTSIDVDNLRNLDSRYSTIIWMRLQSWKSGAFPPPDISFGWHPSSTAYQIRVDKHQMGLVVRHR